MKMLSWPTVGGVEYVKAKDALHILQQKLFGYSFLDLVNKTLDGISSAKTVVEYGCGSGDTAKRIIKERSDITRYHATDYSEKMIRPLIENCPYPITCEIVDILNIPLEHLKNFDLALVEGGPNFWFKKENKKKMVKTAIENVCKIPKRYIILNSADPSALLYKQNIWGKSYYHKLLAELIENNFFSMETDKNENLLRRLYDDTKYLDYMFSDEIKGLLEELNFSVVINEASRIFSFERKNSKEKRLFLTGLTYGPFDGYLKKEVKFTPELGEMFIDKLIDEKFLERNGGCCYFKYDEFSVVGSRN